MPEWYSTFISRIISKAGTTENNKGQELIPDCCACGTAKYQMTFHGLWSRQTHPNQFPTRLYPFISHNLYSIEIAYPFLRVPIYLDIRVRMSNLLQVTRNADSKVFQTIRHD